ncbi:MAG: hypothetical protein HFI29_15010 [Lachnospiraceae bacterium]|jgi:hypothetical protein|nr:hypothetical protein [Lachnospiraceae bacterium]
MVNYKKILAAALATTMVMGSSMAVFAADQEGGASGEGETQYVEENDVFNVVFPTVAEGATTFNYLLDPNGLIAETDGDRYTGKVFDDDKSVYFLRSEQVDGTVGGSAGKCDYTDTSDAIKVTNKSTDAVELTVTATVEETEGIKMAANSTFAGTDAELYLGLVGTDGTTPTEKGITAAGVTLTQSIPADAAAYEVKWDSTDKKYKKALTTAAQAADYAGFKYYSFSLKGACNTATGTDWSGLTDKAPKVDLVWTVKDFTITGPQVSLDTNGLITITNLTADQNYQAVTITDGEDKTWQATDLPSDWNLDNWSSEDGGSFTIQLGEQWIQWIIDKGGSATVTLTLTDGTDASATQTFTTGG